LYYIPSILTLTGVWFTAMIIPGPDFAAIIQHATAYSRRDGILVALGITSAIMIWIIGSMAGLSILFARFSWITVVMKIGGALFLAYLGITSIIQYHRTHTPEPSTQQPSSDPMPVLSYETYPQEEFKRLATPLPLSMRRTTSSLRPLRRVSLVPYEPGKLVVQPFNYFIGNGQAAIAQISHSGILHTPARIVQKTAGRSAFSSWRVGFLTNIGNPKAVIFFSSLFVTILPVNPPLWLQATSLISMVLVSAAWYCTVACIFSTETVVNAYMRAKRWIDYITGGIFIVLAISLILER
jgi:threonine/homoserine/homoserine lactone efflux protein